MTWQLRQIDVRVLLLAGMLVLTGILILWQDRWTRVGSIPHPAVPAGRLTPGGSLPDQQIRFYQARLADNPREAASWNMLAIGYMRKLRESGDPGYVLRSELALRRALALDPRDQEAPRLLAWVALVKHEFMGARQQAEALIRETPDDDRLYGILGDANVELGRYPEARAAFQRMSNLKPGPAAYTRIAYLRQLHGDLPGAVRMKQLAEEAASPRDRENLAWTLVQLGHLYFAQGDLHRAALHYTAALRVFPGYAYSEAGLGDVRAAQGRFYDAIQRYKQSIAAVPLPAIAATLGDVYLRLGRQEEAEHLYALVEYVGQLTPLNRTVYNRDLAYFYADHDRHLDQAVALGEREAALRHDIYTLDTLAWAYFKTGRYDDAAQMIGQALALGTRDASLFYHAGMIAWKRGDRSEAAHDLALALHINPYFHVLHADTARRILAGLRP